MSDICRYPSSPALSDADLADLYGFPTGIRMNFVTSLDGAVADTDGYSAGLSGAADKRLFGLLRTLCDAILVAAGTLRHEGYRDLRLNHARRAWRRAAGLPEDPTLVIVSATLNLSPDQAAFADAPVRPIVLTHEAAPPDRLTALAKVADVLPIGSTSVDLPAARAALAARGLSRLLCEGGPHLFGALTAADLVDELCLTVSPLLAGAGAGRITAGPPSPPRALNLTRVLTAANTLFLHYTRPPQPPAAG